MLTGSKVPDSPGTPKAKKNGLSLRMQKNIMGKMGANGVKVLIDDTTSDLLDAVHDWVKAEQGCSKFADKFIKNIIKIAVKIGILMKNKQFSKEELANLVLFQQRFRIAALTLISFYEVDFSEDIEVLTTSAKELGKILNEVLGNHLRDKNLSRIDMVFSYLSANSTWSNTFAHGSPPARKMLGEVCSLLSKELERGTV